MFRKIHSNRDPQVTVFKEIRKEFAPYFDKAQVAFRRMTQHYPRFLFVMMVINIALSAILVTTICKRKGDPPKQKMIRIVSPVASGFDRIREAGEALRATVRLKHGIDSLTHLRSLSKTDSIALMNDLDSLRHIRLTINH